MIVGLVAGFAVVGCQGATDPHFARSGSLFVYAVAPELHLNSTDTRPVYYTVWQRRALLSGAVLAYDVCTRPGCPSLAAGGQVMVPYDRIIGYEPPSPRVVEQDAVIFWAHSIPGANGESIPDTVHSIFIKL